MYRIVRENRSQADFIKQLMYFIVDLASVSDKKRLRNISYNYTASMMNKKVRKIIQLIIMRVIFYLFST